MGKFRQFFDRIRPKKEVNQLILIRNACFSSHLIAIRKANFNTKIRKIPKKLENQFKICKKNLQNGKTSSEANFKGFCEC
jgi:hypothetical protein